jgi:AraC family transcriptional regulator
MAGRITGIMAGKRTTLGMDAPELVAAEHGWNGFPLEAHLVGPTRDEVGWSWHSTHIGVCVTGEGDIEVSTAGQTFRYRAKPGNVTVLPRGFGPATIRQFNGRCRFVIVELDVGQLRDLFPDTQRSGPWNLPPVLNGRDPQLVNLLKSMHAEASGGSPSGALYAQSLSLTLAAYAAGRYGAQFFDATASRAGLSRPQRGRLLDYIDANLESNLSLAELAHTVDCSPRHFLRLFRQTFGTTPHRYVADLRVERAKLLLAAGQVPLAELALSLGYPSQSHFTHAFHKATGITPARYRRGR